MDGEDDEDWKGKEKEEQQDELSTEDSFRIVCVASPPATIAAGYCHLTLISTSFSTLKGCNHDPEGTMFWYEHC